MRGEGKLCGGRRNYEGGGGGGTVRGETNRVEEKLRLGGGGNYEGEGGWWEAGGNL